MRGAKAPLRGLGQHHETPKATARFHRAHGAQRQNAPPPNRNAVCFLARLYPDRRSFQPGRRPCTAPWSACQWHPVPAWLRAIAGTAPKTAPASPWQCHGAEPAPNGSRGHISPATGYRLGRPGVKGRSWRGNVVFVCHVSAGLALLAWDQADIAQPFAEHPDENPCQSVGRRRRCRRHGDCVSSGKGRVGYHAGGTR